jgi:hypothetical protein
MFDLPSAAYNTGKYAAFGAYGLTKEAVNWGALAGKAGKWMGRAGKALGFTGVGSAPGAVLAGAGSLLSGEKPQTAMLRAGAAALPMGAGLVADAGIDRMTAPRPTAGPPHMPGLVGEQHMLPGGHA